MKPITKTAMLALLGALLCTCAQAQDRPNNRDGRRGPPREGASETQGPRHAPDPAQAASHVARLYADLAPFDVNNDGQLVEAENEAILAAVEDGSLRVPPHRPPPGDRAEQGRGPEGGAPTPNRMVHHMSAVYTQVHAFDVDKDATLDGDELTALQAAIASGKLAIGGRHGGPRGGQHEAAPEGRRGGRPEGRPMAPVE